MLGISSSDTNTIIMTWRGPDQKKKTCGNTVTKAATWNSSIYLHITGFPAGLYTLESVLRNSNK